VAGQSLVVRGAAGVGESRLGREFAARVRQAGGIVLTGRGSPTAADVRAPEEVFAAITNPRKWWTGDIEESAEQIGDEFPYRYGTSTTPGRRSPSSSLERK
jgi:hypothetical protein